MSNTLENHCIIPATMPNNIAAADHPPTVHQLLTDVLFAPLRTILATADISRKCICLDDITFAILSVMRCLQNSKTGRDFLQTHAIPEIPKLTRGNYFASLKSPRRLAMMHNLARLLRTNHLPALRSHDDRLSTFPELNDWEIWAGDGHFMEHATHDTRNEKDQYAPVGAIYKLDTRTGWAEFLAPIQPTARGTEHEITTLKRQPSEDLRCGATKGKHTLMTYDSAVIDFLYAYNLKQSKSIYILTRSKDNLAPMTVMPRPVDRANPVNALVISDEILYFNTSPGSWRRITVKSPDSDEIHVLLTNEMNLPPGLLGEIYRLRWCIEKAFNQQEQKLDERKAWAKSQTAKAIQAIAICITHNLLHLFKATLKTEEAIEDTKVIDAYRKDLDRREANAEKAGRLFPKTLYIALYRPTEMSLQFIRWIRMHLANRTCYRRSLDALRPLMTHYL